MRTEDLIARGELGEVKLGATEAETLAAFGPPDATSLTRPRILKWGDLEVTFQDGRAILIDIILDGGEPLLPTGVADAVAGISALGHDATVRYVEQLGRRAEAVAQLSFDDQLALRASSSPCMLLFDGDRLTRISVAASG